MFGLADEALSAIRDCLHSDNEGTRLKAAMWVTDRVELAKAGDYDIKQVIREKHTTSSLNDWDDLLTFDEPRLRNRTKTTITA